MWVLLSVLLIVFLEYKYKLLPQNVVEKFARLRGYGWPYYYNLQNRHIGCHYDHYNYKSRCLSKNVILLED